MIGEWRKLHSKEFNDIWSLLTTVKLIKPDRTRWASQVGSIVEMRNAYRVMIGKRQGKKLHERLRRR